MTQPDVAKARANILGRLLNKDNTSLGDLRGDLYLYFVGGLFEPNFWRPIGRLESWHDPRALDQLRLDVDSAGRFLPPTDPFLYFIHGSIAHLERALRESSLSFRSAAADTDLPFEMNGVYSTPDYNDIFLLPDLKAPRLIPAERISLISSPPAGDSKKPLMVFAGDLNYFKIFASNIVKSLEDSTLDLDICFAICGKSVGDVATEIYKLESVSKRHRLSSYFIDLSNFDVVDVRALYTVLRFYVGEWILQTTRRPIILYDMDITFSHEFRGRLFRLPEIADVGLNFNYGPINYVPWRTVNAQCTAVSSSPQSVVFLGFVLSFIDRFFDLHAKRMWFIDQQALFWCYAFCQRFLPSLRMVDNRRIGTEFSHINMKSGISAETLAPDVGS